MGTTYVAEARDGIIGWLETVRYTAEGWGRWKYNAAMIRPWALQASGIAIRILDQLDALCDIGEAQRAEAVAFFESCHDSKDGLYKDPLETKTDRVGKHTWEQIWGQRNGATLEALAILGAADGRPRAPKQFADLTKVDGRTWTLSLDWRDPWRFGESWSRAIRAFVATLPEAERGDDVPVLASMFEAVESEILDPATGYPTRRGCDDDARAMAGLFKVMGGYLAVGRPVPHAERAIDSTLALQHDNGEFGLPRNMCMNWDALWVLRELDLQQGGAYRHDDIVAAGQGTAAVLMNEYRKPDGGFAFHGDHCMTNHHSIRLCNEPKPIGDMLGTTMCLQCIRYVDEWTGQP